MRAIAGSTAAGGAAIVGDDRIAGIPKLGIVGKKVGAMYRFLVFIHVLAALLYMAAHGTSIAVSFRIKSVQTIDDARSLMAVSFASLKASYASLLAVVVSGIAVGIDGGWWRTGWFWTSIAVLVVITGLMVPLGAFAFHRIRWAAGVSLAGRRQPAEAPPSPDPEAMKVAIASVRPGLLSVIGFGGVVILVWLMMYKPF